MVDYGQIQLPKSKPPHRERFLAWAEELQRLLHKHKPNMVLVEELHMSRNLNTMKILCGILAITAITVPEEIAINTCHQSTAKKDIVKPYLGRAKLNKEDVFKWATEKYQLSELTFKDHNDITDAILVADWGLFTFDYDS